MSDENNNPSGTAQEGEGPAASGIETQIRQMFDAVVPDEVVRTHVPGVLDYLWFSGIGKFIDRDTGFQLAKSTLNATIPRRNWPQRPSNERNEDGSVRMVPVQPDTYITEPDNGLCIYGMSWVPGEPGLVPNMECHANGNLMPAPGKQILNLYRPPIDPATLRCPAGVDHLPYLSFIEALIPDPIERTRLLDVLAYKVQNPGKKVNGVIVLAGPQGGGKDTIFVPIKKWLGDLFKVVKHKEIDEKHNAWLQADIALVSETGSKANNAVENYESIKEYSVTPPDTIHINPKHINQYSIPNCVGFFINTNHLYKLFVEDDDRRFSIITCVRGKDDYNLEYFVKLYKYFEGGGWIAAIQWLNRRDISKFDPKAPALENYAKHQLKGTIAAVRRDEIDDVIDEYFSDWLRARMNDIRKDDPDRFNAMAVEAIGQNWKNIIDDRWLEVNKDREEKVTPDAVDENGRTSADRATLAFRSVADIDAFEIECLLDVLPDEDRISLFPRVVTIAEIKDYAKKSINDEHDIKRIFNSSKNTHRLRRAGYVPLTTDDLKEARFSKRIEDIKVDGKRHQTVYVRKAVKDEDVKIDVHHEIRMWMDKKVRPSKVDNVVLFPDKN